MSILDKWLTRFFKKADAETAAAEAAQAERDAALAALEANADTNTGHNQRANATARPQTARPLQDVLDQARLQLTTDSAGLRYAESEQFSDILVKLDGVGRRRAADQLLADALLVTPSLHRREQLATRLLHSGDRAGAKPLLEQLAVHPAHASRALTRLGRIAEDGDDETAALRAYERALALDIDDAQAKNRARQLRARRENRDATAREQAGLLARLLGARAAGSRYAIEAEIGRGGAAAVFRARDRVAQRDVALKVFHARGDKKTRTTRIQNEARIAASLDHPHLVPVYDAEPDRDMIVMALCDGGSLRQLLSKQRMGVARTADIVAVLLLTLADVHAAGHVHLDIKPSNILFHGDTPLLTDFGAAGMGASGAQAATRAYVSPEQLAGQAGTAAADLYALGLVLHECLTGALWPVGARHNAPTVPTLEPGPRRRGFEAILAHWLKAAPAERPTDFRAEADAVRAAAALPVSDRDGAALNARLHRLADAQPAPLRAAAHARLDAHPVLGALETRVPGG